MRRFDKTNHIYNLNRRLNESFRPEEIASPSKEEVEREKNNFGFEEEEISEISSDKAMGAANKMWQDQNGGDQFENPRAKKLLQTYAQKLHGMKLFGGEIDNTAVDLVRNNQDNKGEHAVGQLVVYINSTNNNPNAHQGGGLFYNYSTDKFMDGHSFSDGMHPYDTPVSKFDARQLSKIAAHFNPKTRYKHYDRELNIQVDESNKSGGLAEIFDSVSENPVSGDVQTDDMYHEVVDLILSGNLQISTYKFKGSKMLVNVEFGNFIGEFTLYIGQIDSARRDPSERVDLPLSGFRFLDSTGKVIWVDTENKIQRIYNNELKAQFIEELRPAIVKYFDIEDAYMEKYDQEREDQYKLDYFSGDPSDHEWKGEYDDVKPKFESTEKRVNLLNEGTLSAFEKLCGVKLIKENTNDGTYFETLAQAIEAVEEKAEAMGFTLDDDAVWNEFGTGGVPYETTREGTIPLLKDGKPIVGKSGKPMNRSIHVSLYRMPSGKYELTAYKTW